MIQIIFSSEPTRGKEEEKGVEEMRCNTFVKNNTE
jgi:hypothetical protein